MKTLIGAAEPPQRPAAQPMTVTYQLRCPVTGVPVTMGCRCSHCRPDLHLVPSTVTNVVVPALAVPVNTAAAAAHPAAYSIRWGN